MPVTFYDKAIWFKLPNSLFFACICILFVCGITFLNPIALRKAKIVCSFGLSECSRVKLIFFCIFVGFQHSRVYKLES